MFKPHKGICTGRGKFEGCGNPDVIIMTASRLLCQECERKRKPPKPLARTAIKKKPRKITGEYLLFETIAATRPHVCFVTGKVVNIYNEDKTLNVWCFPHILGKAAYPAFRLYDKNVQIMLPRVHQIYDAGNESERAELEQYPGWKKLMDLHSQLKSEYYKVEMKHPGTSPF